MPSGDEGTGLHAFDDLDPVSTVSALTALPVQEPPPRTPDRRLPPLPGRNPGASSHSAGLRGGPPPAPRGALRSGVDDDAESPELSATNVATDIDMDWDEEEVQTQLRDAELDAQLAGGSPVPPVYAGGAASPFRPADSGYPGNPSPFGQSRQAETASTFRHSDPEADWEDDAQTRVISHPLPLPRKAPPKTLSRESNAAGVDSLTPSTHTVPLGPDYPTPRPGLRAGAVGLAAIVLLGAGFGARSLLAGPESANITLVTSPADAEVLIDGRPLVGQTSPFTAQGLLADAEHSLVVRRDGYSELTQQFKVEEGEFKALPSVELKPLRVDTGVVLSSVPEGAEIHIDGVKLPQTTPAKLTALAPGLHLVRLVSGDGYQPWETQIALGSGQMIELPVARLVARQRSVEPVASSGDSPRRSVDRSRRPSRGPAPVSAAPPAYNGGGAVGTLRLNSRPWSQIYVDGHLVGNTPQMNLPLAAGSHQVKLVNPQLGMSKSFQVQIQGGQVATKIVDMVE